MAHIDENAIPDFASLLPEHIKTTTIHQWLQDDVPSFDVGGLVVGTDEKTAHLWMKTPGVIVFAGKPFFDAVMQAVGCSVNWIEDVSQEGIKQVNNSDQTKVLFATVKGPANALLRAERTALNIISRCSGVATASANAVDEARKVGWAGQVAGTRKTTPGFRIVEKYGLLVGGASTHRLDLSQMVMLKDNHIWSAGSITKAVKLAKKAAGFSQKIEVECQSLEDAVEAATAGADIVMLDNFESCKLKSDAKTLKGQFPHILIEASGGITTETMSSFLSEDVDIISQGRLTHGYSCIDFSLKIAR